MVATEKSYLKKVVFEMDFGIWEKFQQLEFGDIGFRQGVRNKRIGIGKHKIYLGLIWSALRLLQGQQQELEMLWVAHLGGNVQLAAGNPRR